ncbi:hypothetical protein CHLNCDRAFT_49694 [Chlorella variabilis]|uniref:Uncharacterized protein n=1 Tax=Chlorella variabilis TaxID=554065 RepID=E1Z3G2_CHLVA|nr:hypothetical protein CHLNCDRAFT_49694 [Chlorella variabilis]EFN59842.1 hypothetical protein CHLNCDRAFT_49694 [Chlorella variabilis]|eukprot:XP_005851944.1 hypothetical protein CHLNCDRAFT_49694 [Chlorella variabilis]
MQFAALRPAATRLARPPARPPASSRQSITPFSATQPAAAGQPGDKLLPLLRTPFDLLALPGRVALGTLQSLPEILEKLPADVERLSLLAQDPRPLEDKQAEVLGELEDRVCGYLQKGTDTEAEVLGSVGAVLPDTLKEALPETLKDALKPRSGAGDDAWSGSSSSNGNGSGPPKPLATWTITSDDETVVVVEEEENLPPMTPAAIAASQTAAEVMEVNAAVAALHEQLTALQANTDPSRANMIKLNLREAEQMLAGRLEQMAPSHRAVGDATVQAAIREAEALLLEVRALNV